MEEYFDEIALAAEEIEGLVEKEEAAVCRRL